MRSAGWNTQTHFLLHNYHPSIGDAVTESRADDGQRAAGLLKRAFDAVGRTEELERFMDWLGALLGRQSRAPLGTAPLGTESRGALRHPHIGKAEGAFARMYNLSSSEMRLTREANRLDSVLYRSFLCQREPAVQDASARTSHHGDADHVD